MVFPSLRSGRYVRPSLTLIAAGGNFGAPSANTLKSFSIICVTGQMAAGKNYICSQLEKEGWLSTDLDLTAHKAIELCREEILSAFKDQAEACGLAIENPDSSINRRNLGRLLFKNPALLARQESIIYPKIIELTKEFIAQNKGKKIIINATVLYKTPELLKLCQAIVFVKAPFFIRLIRASRRDHLPLLQILRRFFAQKDLLSRYKAAKSEETPLIFIKNR